jgi:methylase of polypeptide subunit release factors
MRNDDPKATFRVVLTGGRTLELECPAGIHAPVESSFHFAQHLQDALGRSVLDLGCGTGIFACTAAAMGAREVWATDLDPQAAHCAGRNAVRNGLRINVTHGDLFEPLGGRRFDLILCNPPQTPAPSGAQGPKFAGPDGLGFFEKILRDAPQHLTKDGELATLLISLADTARFERLLGGAFHFRRVSETFRPASREEYESYSPGLSNFLDERRRQGLAEFEPEGDGFSFRTRYYRAVLK